MDKQYNLIQLSKLLLLCIFVSACNNTPKDDGSMPPPLHAEPIAMPLNASGGYSINPVTCDSIKELVNSLGDTVRTGVSIPISGKLIHPDSVAEPIITKLARELPRATRSHNVHVVPAQLTTIEMYLDSLPVVPIPAIESNDSSHFMVNKLGDTIQTGLRIPILGNKVPCRQPQPSPALPLRFKDNAIANLQYLDVDQGLISSDVQITFKDSKGHLWIGTHGAGVARYDGTSFVQYTKKEGLVDDIVTSIVEDKDGNIWFGTEFQGICRFDGTSFIHFTGKAGLLNNMITSMCIDSKGNLWIGTLEGASRIEPVADGLSGFITHFTEKEGLVHNLVSSISEDQEGNIWLGTYVGASRFTANSHKPTSQEQTADKEVNDRAESQGHFIQITRELGLVSDDFTAIIEDRQGNIWFGTYDAGVYCYDGSKFTQFTTQEGLSGNVISALMEDSEGVIWIGTMGKGINSYDGQSLTQYTEAEGLSINYVTRITEDTDGNIWISTRGGGVNRLDPRSFNHILKSEDWNFDLVTTITEDHKGDMWLGTWGEGIIYYQKPKANDPYFSYTKYGVNEGLSGILIRAIEQDKAGNFWIATQDQGAFYFDGSTFTNYTADQGLSSNRLVSMLIDDDGSIWFGTIGGGVCRFRPPSQGSANPGKGSFTHFTEKEGMSSSRVWSIMKDSKGKIWFGTLGGGLSLYEPSDDPIKGTITHFTEREGLAEMDVSAIVEDVHGQLWMGSWKTGLCSFSYYKQDVRTSDSNADERRFTYFTEKEGLANNTVRSVIIDPKGMIWISTAHGLSFIAPKNDNLSAEQNEDKTSNYVMRTLLKNDGLKGLEFSTRNVFIDDSQKIWWGNNKATNILDIDKFRIKNEAPQAQLRRLDINERSYDYHHLPDSTKQNVLFESVQPFYNYPNGLQLPFKDNHLTFHFSAINWSAPHKVRYSHRILGLDHSWSPASAESKADYRNLPHGNFVFQVRALGESQQWGEAFDYSFTIRPPWWHTWWAYSLYAILLLLAIWRVHKFQQARIIRKEREKAKDKELLQANEIKRAYADLKSTQAQLIHAEKMASLGELTAGIAHEIQNPLNFVNNFSELNSELIAELKEELDNGHLNEAKALASDLSENESKIVHHGKRASAIVKGMLAHSRSGSGEREPTDLNALADEYLRLSYHGLRAKDKSFNADFKTDFDPTLPKINVVPQDIGRVLLNLINNAFQAAAVQTGHAVPTGHAPSLQPLITVTTKNLGDKIEVSVKDNGPGIPEAIKAKIFQPFFTTKPTGQGTGLGLSLSYDIVKAHGGTISLQSENEGTEFAVLLPI